MKHYFVLAVMFVAGIVFGAYLSRPALAHAQAATTTMLHVTRTRGHKQDSLTVPGEVVGFACGSSAAGGVEDSDCYVLSRE
jgi:hypothetical protein